MRGINEVDLDAYITGEYDYSEDNVVHVCPNDHEWEVPMFYELGGWFYFDDDDQFCPECGEAGDPDE